MAIAPYLAPVDQSAGCMALSLIARPLCVPVLRAHRQHPLRFNQLRERLGTGRETPLRREVGKLRAVGALERRVLPGMPYTVEDELTDAGRGLLDLAQAVDAWLVRRPKGSIPLGSDEGKAAIKALIGGWSSGILRELTASPCSLAELSNAIPEVSYPSLERRLSAMRDADLVEALPAKHGRKPYAICGWAREADAVLQTAGGWERVFSENTLGA